MKVLYSDIQTNNKVVFCFGNESKDSIDIMKKIKFDGELGEIKVLNKIEKEEISSDVYIGLGEYNFNRDDVKEKFAQVFKKMQENHIFEYSLEFSNTEISKKIKNEIICLFVEVVGLLEYRFAGYKTEEKEANEQLIYISADYNNDDLEIQISRLINLVKGVGITRDVVNMPANYLYPLTFGDIAQKHAETFGFSIERISQAKLEAMNFGGMLAVGQGSVHDSELLILRYHGDEHTEQYSAFVGKGITFDSGGYCLKPSKGIQDMKNDMAGAGAVLGFMCAVAANKLKANIIVAIPLCENLIGGNATLPGSVITTYGKKTVEVKNTDAEGRLILVDALAYVSELDCVNEIIDIATLTGSSFAAFAGACSAVVTNNQTLFSALNKAAESTGEKIWQMPLFKLYKEGLKSEIADLSNIS
ncbi:MAG: M17 family peptidase N-terminal domain-containing protein, partial [Eubacteriales bacterium]